MRTRLRFSFEMHGTYHFYDLVSQEYVRFFSSAMLHIKDQLRSGTEIEIVEEMTALEGGFGSTLVLANLENIRIIEKRNFLGGNEQNILMARNLFKSYTLFPFLEI